MLGIDRVEFTVPREYVSEPKGRDWRRLKNRAGYGLFHGYHSPLEYIEQQSGNVKIIAGAKILKGEYPSGFQTVKQLIEALSGYGIRIQENAILNSSRIERIDVKLDVPLSDYEFSAIEAQEAIKTGRTRYVVDSKRTGYEAVTIQPLKRKSSLPELSIYKKRKQILQIVDTGYPIQDMTVRELEQVKSALNGVCRFELRYISARQRNRLRDSLKSLKGGAGLYEAFSAKAFEFYAKELLGTFDKLEKRDSMKPLLSEDARATVKDREILFLYTFDRYGADYKSITAWYRKRYSDSTAYRRISEYKEFLSRAEQLLPYCEILHQIEARLRQKAIPKNENKKNRQQVGRIAVLKAV